MHKGMNKGAERQFPSFGGKSNMCEGCVSRRPVARRAVLKLAVAAAAGVLAQEVLTANAAEPAKSENVLSPDAALDRLMQGNARYIEGLSRRHDFKHEREALSKGQNPFAAVLSCSDSRIVPEYCFDTARGDLFVCRVAGNFASDDIIASLEYAVQVLKTPLILVLGHAACGAIDATIKSIKDRAVLPGHLPLIATALTPAVTAAQGVPGDLLANAIRRNVVLTVEKLMGTGPILKSFLEDKKIRVVGGVYELTSGRVELI
jgi:carbonic anhydrase